MTIRELNQTIEEGVSLKQIAQAYGEIASVKIRKIRAEVEKNRAFYNEISTVYRTVKQQSAAKKIAINKPKKTICILLTSNYRFYGNIDSQVLRHFIVNTATIATDRLVIGKTGRDYLKNMRYFNTYKLIETKEDLPTIQEMNALSAETRDYKQVLVFYPQLITVLIQRPIVTDITESQVENAPKQTDGVEKIGSYVIFEPELQKMVEFFDSQIILLLLEQTFFEAELARTASRLISMDQAQVEANNFIKQQRTTKAHLLREIESNRLLENLAAIKAITKGTVL